MFTLYDLAEVGACFAAFFTMLFVLVRRPGNLSARVYTATALVTTAMWVAYILFVPRVGELRLWQHGVLAGLLSLATALWLLFLLLYAREPAASLFRIRSLTMSAVATLLVAATGFGFFTYFFNFAVDELGTRHIAITASGKYYLALLIAANTFGLLQLESTYRSSQGNLRKQLLPSLLAVALLLGLNLISGMLGLLLSRVEFLSVQLGATLMIVALILLSRFVVFEEQKGQGVVISREAVYSSVAVLLVGAYFVVIGLTVKLLVSLGGSPQVFMSVLAAFLMIVLFVALLLSGSIRQRWRGLVDRSVYGGRADLLAELTAFAEEVTAATDRREMFEKMESVLRRKCGMRDVRFYLRGERAGEFYESYPTVALEALQLPELEDWLFRKGRTVSVSEFRPASGRSDATDPALPVAARGHELIPLSARREFVGFISGTPGAPLGAEMRFLIDSMSHQLAMSLLSARQSEKLLETRELASFTKISSFVVHDVKNLVSMVSMILQNAEKKFDDPRFQQMTLETLRGAQERMKRLISRLTSPAKQIDFALTNCDLAAIVVDLIREMNLNARPKIALANAIAAVPPVTGNEEKLRSVLANLLINAVEAMPNGGELRLNAQADDRHLVVAVSDTGVGMTPEFMRDRLFRPFQTSKSSGLGIGLFQSRELVEQMGGNLTVSSVAGQGTTFKLKLRRA